MERHFALPIVFAAAFHGALLFGFSKKPQRPALPEEQTTRIVPFVLPPLPEDPPPPSDEDPITSVPKTAPEAPRPSLPEPPAVRFDAPMTISAPPMQPATAGEVHQVPPLSLGILGGAGDNPWGTSVLNSNALDNTPRTRFQTAPLYPHEARRDGIRGEVVVEFIVDESGRVRDPRVIRSNHRAFEEPTLRAVSKWRFEPGRRDGQIVRFRMAVPVVYTLSE